jgi:hypothetical protein
MCRRKRPVLKLLQLFFQPFLDWRMHRREKGLPFIASLLFPPKASFAEKGLCRGIVLFQMGHGVPEKGRQPGTFLLRKIRTAVP